MHREEYRNPKYGVLLTGIPNLASASLSTETAPRVTHRGTRAEGSSQSPEV